MKKTIDFLPSWTVGSLGGDARGSSVEDHHVAPIMGQMVFRQKELQTTAGTEGGSSGHPEESEEILDPEELVMVETVFKGKASAVDGKSGG